MAYELSSSSSGEEATGRFHRSPMPTDSVSNARPRRSKLNHSISAPGKLVQMGNDKKSRRSSMPIKPRRVLSIQEDMHEMVCPSSGHSRFSKDDIRSTAASLSSSHHNIRSSLDISNRSRRSLDISNRNRRSIATSGMKKVPSMVHVSSSSNDGSTGMKKVTSFANLSQAVMGNFMTSGNQNTPSPEDTIKQDQADQIRYEMNQCVSKVLLDNDQEAFLKLKAEMKQSGMATSAAATRHHFFNSASA